MRNTYLEEIKEAVKNHIENEIDFLDFDSLDELGEKLHDDLWADDEATGNGSGSYFFNSYKAQKRVLESIELLAEASREFGEEVVNLLDEEWEKWDVTIRCYLLSEAISEVMDEIEEEFNEAHEEAANIEE